MADPAGNPPGLDAVVVAAARNGEFDRYVAALLAPPAARAGLVALAAFSAELVRIAPLAQREPAMGEIRLQWWRDAVSSLRAAGVAPAGHPVADALGSAAGRHGWPQDSLIGIIDAHAHDSLADAFADDAELLATLELGEGALFALAARTLGADPHEIEQLSRTAGVAYGLARRLAALPRLLARKHVPLPQSRLAAAGIGVAQVLAGENRAALRPVLADMIGLCDAQLQEARGSVADLPRGIRPAFLPLALVGPYLRVAEQSASKPLGELAEVAPLKRLLRIAGMQMFGRF